MKKAICSWSSGKDSAFALAQARKRTDIEVVGLISSFNAEFERVAIHGTRRTVARAQAQAAGLDLIEVELPYPCSNKIYEACIRQQAEQLAAQGIRDWIFGDLFLEDIAAYRRALLNPLGIEVHMPLWKRSTAQLCDEMLAQGLEAYIVCLDPNKLPKTLCGARYDHRFLEALPKGTDPCGENGEFHTVVADAPGFAWPLHFNKGRVVERSGFVYCDFELA